MPDLLRGFGLHGSNDVALLNAVTTVGNPTASMARPNARGQSRVAVTPQAPTRPAEAPVETPSRPGDRPDHDGGSDADSDLDDELERIIREIPDPTPQPGGE